MGMLGQRPSRTLPRAVCSSVPKGPGSVPAMEIERYDSKLDSASGGTRERYGAPSRSGMANTTRRSFPRCWPVAGAETFAATYCRPSLPAYVMGTASTL